MAEKSSFLDSKFGGFLNNLLFGLPGILYSEYKSSKLTGAEREQNSFNAQQAQLQRDFEAGQVEQMNAFNAEQAEINRQFQVEMSNTAYQRSVADMQRAGLNPALAYGNGAASTPSGAMATAGAASGSAASGSGRGIPFTMSEVMAAFRMRKEMKLLDEQAKNVAADSEKKEAETRRLALESDWLPKIYAADLGLKEGTLEKYSAEVASLLASAEGQRILNEWNPKIFASQLENDKVNRLHTVAGIHKIEQEVKNLISENENILQDTNVKLLTQGLIAAQTSLASQQSNEVSARTWRQEFENSFTELYGHKPDEPIWNAVTSLLAHTGSAVRDVLKNPGKYFSSAVERFRDTR